MTRRLLIGLTGRAGTGKSTVARILEEECSFREIALTDPIRDMAAALLAVAGIPPGWIEDRALKELPTALGVSYRQIAQTLGTQWGRERLLPDLWLRVAALRLEQCPGDDVVITDVRFPNEAEWLAARGGHLVRVVRDTRPVRPHESESHTDTLPVITELLNFGSPATLLDQVIRLVDHLRTLP